MYKEMSKEFMDIYIKLGAKYGNREIFFDFVKMCAIALYNPFAKNNKMEEEYLNTINKYQKEEQNLFPKMFAELINMYQEEDKPIDILGPFFEREQFSNGNLGQFFTPAHISDFMSKVTISDKEVLNKKIARDGFITANDCACGAGGMIISFAKAIKEEGINYQQNMLAVANDISEICTYITFIQFALLGIPAIVYCGDTMSQKMRFKLETPMYFLQYWKFEKFFQKNKEIETESEAINDDNIISQNIFKEVSLKGNNQFCLW